MSHFNTIEEAVAEIRAGKMVIVVDDEGRENEGDLIMAAEMVTPEAISFMAKKASGLICVPLSANAATQLFFEPMVSEPREVKGCHFTVSVDAASGITTGISAFDRATTILRMCDVRASGSDFVRPGHVFPLIARGGGVFTRAGHTEAACDLAVLAGFRPLGVICEILLDTGEMARGEDLFRFARDHHLHIISIKDLIAYRAAHEVLVRRMASARLPTVHGVFQMFVYTDIIEGKEHVALVHGDLKHADDVLVRVHSECMTGDVFGSSRCDCGDQLNKSMEMISREPCGIIVYLRHEGRGIGLINKLKSYELQDLGHDTVEANRILGFTDDGRHYGFAAQILRDLGVDSIRLLTNNPRKIQELATHGIHLAGAVPLEIPPTPLNRRYLKTKKEKLGHVLKHV